MKLFITDLDGTLLDNDDHASEINVQALLDLKKHGYEIVIASGRQLPIIKEMNFDILAPYVISQNGSLVYDPQGNALYKNAIQANQAFDVCQYCDENNLLYLVYTADQMYVHLPKNTIHQLYEMAKENAKNEAELIDTMEMFYGMYASLPAFDQAQLKKVKNQESIVYKIEVCAKNSEAFLPLEAQFKDILSVTSSWGTNREITAKHVNKGTAIEALCDHLKITTKDCVAIGDNQNDIEMLKTCGYSIAMGNASEEIQALCDMTTTTCVEHGVANAIQRMLK